MKKTNCGQAFPMPIGQPCAPGMTLRQWYAGMALTGPLLIGHLTGKGVAMHAFALADDMLAREADEEKDQ